ncbi:MAG: HEPN domain-containing protein [Gaiellaceae bacterium]
MNEVERLAREWLEHAFNDLRAAETLHDHAELAPRSTCWFAQQAAEKAMKALLVLDQIEYPLTHDLVETHARLPRPLQAASRHDLRRLSEFAIRGRYPGPWPEPARPDAEDALAAAREIVDETRRRFDGES